MSLEGVRIYHSGSTELVPELKAVRADLAVLVFWEGYIMSTQDAADLARSLRATIVIPTHCKPEEAVKPRDLLKGATQVELMASRQERPRKRREEVPPGSWVRRRAVFRTARWRPWSVSFSCTSPRGGRK